MMDVEQDIDDDTHICLKCRTTITGLDNYVKHRKAGCRSNNANNRPVDSACKVRNTSVAKNGNVSPSHTDSDPNLKADDFFSSLELQSSAKKAAGTSPGSSTKSPSGMLTRSRASAVILANTSVREPQCVKNENELLGTLTTERYSPQTVIEATPNTCLMKTESRENLMLKVEASGISERSDQEESACEEDSNDEYEDEDEDEDDDGMHDSCPPRSHTGGKWKPGGLMTRGSPPSWTRTSSSSTHAEEYRGNSTGEWSLLLDECAGSSAVSTEPPPHFTGGKWKPPLPTQAVITAQQVCRGTHSDEEDDVLHDNLGGSDSNNTRIPDTSSPRGPPPGHTSGKWVPGKHVRLGEGSGGGSSPGGVGVDNMLPLRKSGSTVQYWCRPCSRRLSSRTLYERHLLSELHFKRTLQERELDEDHPRTDHEERGSDKRTVRRTEVYLNSELWTRSKRRRLNSARDEISGYARKQKRRANRRKEVRCEVCRSKVWRHLLGKHLVSHYHCRKAPGHPQATSLILDNIHSVVRQAPFQCSPCKFYCNTIASFKQHWTSQEHDVVDKKVSGRFWCSFCKYECESSAEMECHLEGVMHRELVSVINRSVPIVIRKRTVFRCGVCGEEFRYNVQLRRHAASSQHHEVNTGSDGYQERYLCSSCGFIGNSCASLQRHVLHSHKSDAGKQGAYFCSACSLHFNTPEEAALHRRSQEHKYSALASRKERGLTEDDLTKSCPHCGGNFENVLQLKTHLREQHAEFPYRCAHCGMTFTLPQEVSRHVRESACMFRNVEPKMQISSVKKEVPGTSTGTSSTDVEINEEDGGCKLLECRDCPYQTDSRAELLFHEVLHGEPMIDPIKTEEYDAIHESLETITNQTQAPRYQCPLCTRVFRKASLRCHLRTHTQERPFVCNVCYRGFGYRSSMITHMKRAHRGGSGHVCEVCSFRTASKASMERHRLTHTQRNKPFLCAVCGASFFLKNTLQQHMKVHTGKDFKCDHEGCVFSCRSQAELRNHQQIHSEHRPFHCDTCSYSAKTKPQLLRHHTVHQMQKPHQCPHCPFAARMASHLRRHLRLHTGAKPYRCPYCSYTCNILENLRKHVLSTSKHPGKHLYECRFCDPADAFKSNLARDFRAHLVTTHSDHFGSALLAASYVAGIYDANDDPKFVEEPIQLQPRWRRSRNKPSTVTTRTLAKAQEEEKRVNKPNEPENLSAHVNNAQNDGHISNESFKDDKAMPETAVCLSSTSEPQRTEEGTGDDTQQLLSMVVVADHADDVIYIQLPTDTEGEAMERYCESVLFPSEGDTFLSVEHFNKRRSSGGERSTNSNSISSESAIMLPLGVDEVEEVREMEEVKEGEHMVVIRESSTSDQPQEKESLDEEMTVITIPPSSTSEMNDFLRLPQVSQHDIEDLPHQTSDIAIKTEQMNLQETQEAEESYQKMVAQSLESHVADNASEEVTADQQQQRYLVIFK